MRSWTSATSSFLRDFPGAVLEVRLRRRLGASLGMGTQPFCLARGLAGNGLRPLSGRYGRRGGLRVRVLAPEHQDLPDRLNRMGLELPADLLHPRRARFALVGGGLHLDELVGLERPVDLGEDGFGEPLVADDDDRLEGVGLGAQLAAPGQGDRCFHGAIIARIAGRRP